MRVACAAGAGGAVTVGADMEGTQDRPHVNPVASAVARCEVRGGRFPISSVELKKLERYPASGMPSSEPPILARGADLDVAILREMYPGRGVSISGIDPRLNANRLAGRLGISRAKVASRLRAWADSGFLRRFDVWPNPFLFGLTGVTFDVRASDRLRKSELFERLALVHGAVGGFELVGEWIAVTFVLPIHEDPARTAALLRGISGVAEVGGGISWGPSSAGRPLSPLDLRIVRVLRRYPTESLAAIARHVGVSTRTITTRYGRLLDEQAVWFVPVLDFRAMAEPVVSLNVLFRTGADREPFARALRRHHPHSIEFVRATFGPVLPDTSGSYFVVVPSAARVEELERWVRESPGVETVEALTLVRLVSFPDTFDRLIDTVNPPPTGRADSSRPRSRI